MNARRRARCTLIAGLITVILLDPTFELTQPAEGAQAFGAGAMATPVVPASAPSA